MSLDSSFENAILRNLLAQTTRAYDEKMAEVHAEKELALVTLASIGDGVISTDAAGVVKYLNPVAEKLTGVLSGEAIGRQLSDIFVLVDEQKGEIHELPLSDGPRTIGDDQAGRSLMLVRHYGERFAVEYTAAPINDRKGNRIGAVIVFQNVSERRLMSLQLFHDATHDSLTGILNRAAFDDHLRTALSTLPREGHVHTLCYLDLDQFKVVNDTLGHLAGDRLLQDVALLIIDEIREASLFARLGGDEFGLLLLDCTRSEASAFADHILYALRAYQFEWESKSIEISASIGVVPITGELKTVDQLMSAADHACYTAKEKGRDRVQLYQHDDAEIVRRSDEMGWVHRIRETLENRRFRLYAQRIVPIAATRSRGYSFEVLARVVESDGRILLPGDIIRAAERYGLMSRIDRWVIAETLRSLRASGDAVISMIDFVSINLSAVTLRDPSITEYIRDEIGANGIPPEKVCFEITETSTIEDLPAATQLMRELRRMRCRFALDDFGAGMSSFSYLKELPVNFLKIDGCFISDIATDPYDRAMVEAIHQMARVIGIDTVAEAVTSGDVLARLRAIGIGFGQGHWFGFPRPIEDLLGSDLRR